MTVIVVVGAQWGDEGKGKIVDYLAESADVVARYAGGPNAGHTLVVGGEKIIVRLVPSGILREGKLCVMGNGMVVDPALLVEEIEDLEKRGHRVDGRLRISYRAHLILPYHILADGLREQALSPTNAIGTTRRGIGPAYEDKAARRGLPAVALRDMDRTRQLVEHALNGWAPYFQSCGHDLPRAKDIVDQLRPLAQRIVPLLADTSQCLQDQIDKGRSVLFEGAQGTLLDLDHGTYPFVTSSSAVAGGACTGSGLGPRTIDRVVGAAKAYVTRVGSGPFPTELDNEAGAHMKQVGAEFGSVTGRPRRAGWLDLPALRFAIRVNGLDSLVLTKLDVLTGLDPIRVCVAYDTPDGRTDVLPVDRYDHLDGVLPVYEELPGWTEPIAKIRHYEALPAAARAYVAYVEKNCNTTCDLISVGPGREAIIVNRHPFDVG